ncbi:uncharacterized protein LOC131951395, partial [Physella acuta]|uniref:uncharacterized protein LOC131951395 n=1 Tax=Physella acuta TaxID=109671 RepID=UPI0027DB33D7
MDYTTLLISFSCLLNTCSTQTTSTSPPLSTTLQTPTTNPQTSTPPPPTTHSTTDLPVANTTSDYSDIISDEIEKLQSSGYLFFPHIYRAFLDAGRRPLFYNSSEDCSRNLETYYNAFIDRKGWAWNIYDATGKQGAGLFTGALTWVGNFHQCINSMGYYFSELTTGEAPPTQFCAVYIATPQWVVNLLQGFNLPFPVQKPPFIADICTVVGCTESDLQNIVQRYVNDVSWSGNYSVTSVKCRTVKKLRNDAGAIVTLCIIALILLLVVLGTTFEIYLRAKRHGIKSSRDILIGETAPVNSIKSTSSTPTIRGRPRKKSSLTWLAYKNEAFVPDIDITETPLSGASPTEQPSPTTPGLAQITEAQNEDGNKPEENHSDTANGSLLKQEKQSTPENIVTNHVNGTTVPNDETKDENTDPHTQSEYHPTDPHTQSEYHPTDDHAQSEYHPTDDHDRLPLSDYHPDLPSPNGLKKRSSKDSRKASVFFPRMQHKHLHTQLSKDNSTLQGTVHLFEKILVTFSIRRNLTNVLGKGHADTMFCLNGVRVCSIGWIVLGSYYNAIYSNPTLI